MKKELSQKIENNRKIIMGYVLEAGESREAGTLSYDDMRVVGWVKLADDFENIEGDDLNDTPYNCNGSVYSGEEIELEKGDVVIVIKKS